DHERVRRRGSRRRTGAIRARKLAQRHDQSEGIGRKHAAGVSDQGAGITGHRLLGRGEKSAGAVTRPNRRLCSAFRGQPDNRSPGPRKMIGFPVRAKSLFLMMAMIVAGVVGDVLAAGKKAELTVEVPEAKAALINKETLIPAAARHPLK